MPEGKCQRVRACLLMTLRLELELLYVPPFDSELPFI